MNALSVLTISQLNMYVKSLLDGDSSLNRVFVSGEISNFTNHYRSGHLYLSLKDEKCVIKAVMFSSYASRLRFEPKDGMKVLVRGRVSLYEQSGQYQLYIEDMQPDGLGALNLAYEQLKEKLAAEGLFDTNKKQPLPEFPNKVGVITSPTGAVIHDILNVSLRRNPDAHILLCPVRVQGIGADEEVVEAIHLLERLEHVSVIIVARGGGSMEDLWTFNEERVVRAVAMCKKPIVSAVGHETDVTLCDLAADLRAPTPSAAAECVVPVRDEMLNKIEIMRRQMQESARNAVAERQNALKLAQIKLSANHPSLTIRRQEERLAQRMDALLRAAERQIQNRQTRLETQTAALELLSPYAALKRGYAIVQNAGRAISKAGGLCVGDEVTVRFADGVIHAEVLSKEESHGEETDV